MRKSVAENKQELHVCFLLKDNIGDCITHLEFFLNEKLHLDGLAFDGLPSPTFSKKQSQWMQEKASAILNDNKIITIGKL